MKTLPKTKKSKDNEIQTKKYYRSTSRPQQTKKEKWDLKIVSKPIKQHVTVI